MTQRLRFKGKLIKVATEIRRLPNGRRIQLETIEHPGAVLIVPFLNADRLVLIRQFRPVLNMYLYELPAGTLNPGERPLSCAGRELMEETGYRAGTLVKVGKIFPVPGYSTEVITIFKAQQLKSIKQISQKDADEVIRVCVMTRAQIKKLFARGRMNDAKTISALAFCGVL